MDAGKALVGIGCGVTKVRTIRRDTTAIKELSSAELTRYQQSVTET